MRFRRYTKIVSGIPARPLVAVLGPTASGKSALALLLARQFDGEIINCDSLQIYRGFDIGTAKTPPAERLDIPHHLADILDPLESCDAGRFASLARPIIHDVSSRGRLPVLAGGTGFYLRATLDGLSPGPQRDPALRQRLLSLEARRPGRLHRLLLRLDPPTAARIHLNDHQKLVRALEICLLAGRPASRLFSAGAAPLSGFAPLKLVLLPERGALRAQIALRTRQMFETGLVEEVSQLLCQGLPATAKPFEAIGYKEALGVVEGRLSVDQAIQLTFFATCQYAKRQITWFRREPGAQYLSGFGGDLSIASSAAGIVCSFLQSLHASPSSF
ncbi:MAG TPA: tRNA (adenosine(37)-N6)-dimethylallyltransferase MiaA [Solibacterales bacterium]|nr:tRNA (adenosine(37)-N6)-dimethylallyltransferase MiaA [Bryobacterales bacterium]